LFFRLLVTSVPLLFDLPATAPLDDLVSVAGTNMKFGCVINNLIIFSPESVLLRGACFPFNGGGDFNGIHIIWFLFASKKIII
jgi:hypothetical protein